MGWLDTISGLIGGAAKTPSQPVATPKPVSSPTPPPPAPAKYLDKTFMARIKANMADYKNAAKLTNIPWQALAAIHFREAEFARTVKEPGGPFQLDPGGEKNDLNKRCWDYTVKVCKKYGAKATDINTNFDSAALVGAHEFVSKPGASLYDDKGNPIRENIADRMFSYNGRSKHYSENEQVGHGNTTPAWEWSPYVNNNPNMGRVLKIVATQLNDKGERITIAGTPDPRPGSIIIYDELMSRGFELV